MLKGLYSSNTHLHKHLSYTHTILLFAGLDFGSRRSWAAFISVCLDTIYYQLFILVSSSVSVSLSSYLSGCGLTAAEVFRQFSSVCGSSLWLCLSPPPLQVGVIFLLVPKRGSQPVCLVNPFVCRTSVCRSPSGRDGVWARRGFDHDLLLKPCGRSSPSQTAPTTVNLTLLLPVCSSASSSLAKHMTVYRQMRPKTDSLVQNKTSPLSLNPVYWAWVAWHLIY